MADTSNTHRPVTVHADKQGMSANGSVQWLLEKNMVSRYPIAAISEDNEIKVFICGEEGFKNIYHDILAAQHSLDIVCWGFDPGMPLIRDGKPWTKENTYGELLKSRADDGIIVRLLVWFEERASAKQQNLPGYCGSSVISPGFTSPSLKSSSNNQPLSAQDQRWNYCIHWWNEVLSGLHPNLFVLGRHGDPDAVKPALADDEDSVDEKTSTVNAAIDSEKSLLIKYETHHQKPILIDWGKTDAANRDLGVGYIMGLNSISDFWDRTDHLFDDPQREPDWYGTSHTSLMHANGTPLSREPYQDYASRLRGSVLKGVHVNFETGWEAGERMPPRTAYPSRVDTIYKPVCVAPQKPFKAKGPCQLQVLRTMPQVNVDKSIKAAYRHAASQAQNYIYIEQQYFYYERWAREFLESRKNFTQGVQLAGRDKSAHPILHLFVVIPWPEDAGMVPRTYDTLAILGNGSSVPNQEKSNSEDLNNTSVFHSPSEISKDASKLPKTTTSRDELYVATVDEKQKKTVQQAVGVKAIFCRLVTYNAQGIKAVQYRETDTSKDQIGANEQSSGGIKAKNVMYRQIYIHSKLMMVDDQWLTLGSANLNIRSMAVDSELNVGCAHPETVQDLRNRVFHLMSGGYKKADGGTGKSDDIALAYEKWKFISASNFSNMNHVQAPESGFIVPFNDQRKASYRHA